MSQFGRPTAPGLARSASADPRRPGLATIDTNVMPSPRAAVKKQQRSPITQSSSMRSLRSVERQETPRAVAVGPAIHPAEEPYQDKADAAVESFRNSLETMGQVDLESLVFNLVPDKDEVLKVFRAVPNGKKSQIASPASMAKANDGIKVLRETLKDIIWQRNALIDATKKAEANINQRLTKHQEDMTRQLEHHNDERQVWERQVPANQAAFNQELAASRRELADFRADAEKREVELAQILEEKEKQLREERASSEAQSRQLACVEAELGNCREALQVKTELADNNAWERDFFQAHYETICEQHGATENQQLQAIRELEVIVTNLHYEVESHRQSLR